MEEKQASSKNNRSQSTEHTEEGDDESSLDPSITELALSKLVNSQITHQDRKAYTLDLARMQNNESRQDNFFEDLERYEKYSSKDYTEEIRDESSQNRSLGSNNRKLSISQRLARAERYTTFKERKSNSNIKDADSSDIPVNKVDFSKAISSTSQLDTSSTSKSKVKNPVKILERLKKASEFAEFSNETISAYKMNQAEDHKKKKETIEGLLSDPKVKYKILGMRRNPSNCTEIELVLCKEGTNNSNTPEIGLIVGKEQSRFVSLGEDDGKDKLS